LKLLRGDELAQFYLMRVVEACVLERLEKVVGAQREHRVLASAGDVAERVTEKHLDDTDGPDDRHAMMRLESCRRFAGHRRALPAGPAPPPAN